MIRDNLKIEDKNLHILMLKQKGKIKYGKKYNANLKDYWDMKYIECFEKKQFDVEL